MRNENFGLHKEVTNIILQGLIFTERGPNKVLLLERVSLFMDGLYGEFHHCIWPQCSLGVLIMYIANDHMQEWCG